MQAPTLSLPTGEDRYPVHEEESVPQTDIHLLQTGYLWYVLEARFPQRWVISDVCMYWNPLDVERCYTAADIAVVAAPPPGASPLERPHTYRAWEHGPLLFVVEVASDWSRSTDVGRKKRTYAQDLRVPEYLFIDNERMGLRLWRAEPGNPTVYREVQPGEDGRLWSRELNLGFAFDETGLVRAYTRDGQMLLNYREQAERADEEHRLRDLEARRADEEGRLREQEARRADEEAHRADEEHRLRDEEARRANEEARRANEEARRADEEARRAETERGLREELERRLADALARLGAER